MFTTSFSNVKKGIKNEENERQNYSNLKMILSKRGSHLPLVLKYYINVDGLLTSISSHPQWNITLDIIIFTSKSTSPSIERSKKNTDVHPTYKLLILI